MHDSPTTELKPTSRWGRVFGCDLRSLAIFRIALGLIILTDLFMRSSHMDAMYTDGGVLPRDVAAQFAAEFSHTKDAMGWSLHGLSGSLGWQAALFAVAALAALMMIAGWKTRLATIVSWLLLISLHARNPLILHSGDTLLKLLIFWSIFLPVNRLWSLDAKWAGSPGRPRSLHYCSFATAGLILVVFSLYFFTGISKCNAFWFDGVAMDYVLRLDIYATGLGYWMLDYPWMLKFICWVTLIGEVFVPLLLFVPWHNDRWRMAAMLFFWVFHISISLVMDIGLFSYTSMIAWFALLPASFWDSKMMRRVVPGAAADRVQLGDWVPQWTWGRKAVQGIALFFIVYSLCWNLSNTQFAVAQKLMPPEARFVGKWLSMKQGFVMFDIPPQHSPYFVYEAVLANGSTIDIFRNQPVDHARPKSVLGTISGHHWRRLHRNLVRPMFARYRHSLAQAVVNRWNATHGKDEQVVFMKLTAYLDEIGPDYNGTDQIVQVWGQIGDANAANESLFDSLMRKMNNKGEILP